MGKALDASLDLCYTIGMPTKKTFEINIADLEEVRSKIPEVEAIVEAKRDEVSTAQREFAYWQQVLDRLRLLSGPPRSERASDNGEVVRKPTATDEVLRIVNESGVPLRASEVISRLENRLPRDTVNWALWKLNRENRVQRVGTGVYASLDYEPSSEQVRLVES